MKLVPALLFAAFVAHPVMAATPSLEVAASLYAWELHDEGTETVLERLTTMAAVNSVYLVALMHPEPRPHKSERFSHNPKRERWMPEDAAMYWHPDEKLYGRIRPVRSAHEWLRGTDWLAVLVKAARARGLKTGAEVSHSLLPEKWLMQPENADLLQRDLHGHPAGMHWSGHFACLNHPDVRHYYTSVFTDLASGRDLDFIQTCLLLFAEDELPSAGCFCQSCAAKAKREGIDFDALVKALRTDPHAEPHLKQWRDFRRQSAAEFYQAIAEAVHEANPHTEFRLNHHARIGDTWDDDLLRLVHPFTDSIRISDYAEQSPDDDARREKKLRWLHDTRAIIGAEKPLIAAIGVRPQATPESIRSGVVEALKLGVQGLSIGHYDGAAFSSLRAVREGLVKAKAPGVEPLHGFRLFDSMPKRPSTPEAAGVAANNRRRLHKDETGIAALDEWRVQHRFDLPDGLYDIAITCVDMPRGHATICVQRDDAELGRITLDEDHDAWTVRTLKAILLHRGDTLTFLATRDGEDWALADFVSFTATRNTKP